MQVKDIMTREVQWIHRDFNIQQAAEQMKTVDVGMVPVYDGDRLVGTLTDRDLAIRAIAEKRDPISTKVQDVMSPGITYCFEDQNVEEAANLMAAKQIRRLIVLNREKQLVGVISLGDIAKTGEAKQAATTALENVSKSAS